MTDQPLLGAIVAVTRATDQAGPLVERLLGLGANVVEIPVIAIAEPADGGAALRRAIEDLRAYDWVVLTSPNASRRFVTALEGAKPRRIAAVGPGTATVVEQAGLRVELLPARAIGEGLVDAFPAGPGRVLLPRAAVARDVVPDGLRAKGWTVDVVEAYRTVHVPPAVEDVRRLATADVVCFTSSSTVEALLRGVPADDLPALAVSMGDATTATAAARGVRIDVTAAPSTLDGLLNAVVACWKGRYPLRP